MPGKPTPNASPPNQLARQVDQVDVTDTQRTTLYTALTQDPYRGQVKACRDSGIAGTAGQLRDWFKTDAGVQDHLAEARNDYLKDKRLDIDTLLGKVSAIVHNDESPSQWRATDWAFAVLHKMGAKQAVQVEHTGPEGGAVEVTVEHDYDRLLDKLADIGLVRRGPAAAVDTPDQRLLPARTD